MLSPRAGLVAWQRPRAPPARFTAPPVAGRWPSRRCPPSTRPDMSQHHGGGGAGPEAELFQDTTTSYAGRRRRAWLARNVARKAVGRGASQKDGDPIQAKTRAWTRDPRLICTVHVADSRNPRLNSPWGSVWLGVPGDMRFRGKKPWNICKLVL